MAMQSAADAANHPLIAASGGKITAQQLSDYFAKHGSFPNWRQGPEGPIISSSSAAKSLGYTNPGQITSVVGTDASRAATSGSPGSGVGSVYTPAGVQQAVQQAASGSNAPALAERGLTAELLGRTGTTDLLAQAAYNPAAANQLPDTSGRVYSSVPVPGQPITGPIPPRSRGAANLPDDITQLGPVPATTQAGGLPTSPVGSLAPGSFSTVQQFSDWWNNAGPRMAGDLGSVYNMPSPVLTADNEYLFPGMVGQTFGTGADNALLAERVQAQQLLGGRRSGEDSGLYGPISPLIPPHLISQAGYGPESVLGGQFSLGQTIAADPSLQGMGNQGALDWFNSQTPSGPYAGFQFPQHFGQPQGGATTNLPAGTGTNFNPFGGFGQPGTYQPPGGGGGLPGTGTGGGTPGTGGGGGVGYPTPGGGAGTGGGGTGTGTSGTNPFPPISIDTGTPGGGIGSTSSADAFLADTTNDLGYLRGIAENAGYATDQTPAWQAMIDAQQRNIDRMAAQIGEQFNVSGNRFSSVFGDAMTDFYTQTGLDQNSLLAQMTLASQEAARQRELQAAGQLGQFGYGAGSQLSAQDFQSLMQGNQFAYGAAQNMFNASQNAAQQLLQNSMTGSQGLFNAENQAAQAEAQRQTQLLQLMLGTASGLDQTWINNLIAGGQLGAQQYTIGQDQIDRLYNEFLRTSPEYNPMIPYWYSAATSTPPYAFPQYEPPMLPGLLGGLGGLLGQMANAGIFGGGGGGNPNQTNLSGYFGGILG